MQWFPTHRSGYHRFMRGVRIGGPSDRNTVEGQERLLAQLRQRLRDALAAQNTASPDSEEVRLGERRVLGALYRDPIIKPLRRPEEEAYLKQVARRAWKEHRRLHDKCPGLTAQCPIVMHPEHWDKWRGCAPADAVVDAHAAFCFALASALTIPGYAFLPADSWPRRFVANQRHLWSYTDAIQFLRFVGFTIADIGLLIADGDGNAELPIDIDKYASRVSTALSDAKVRERARLGGQQRRNRSGPSRAKLKPT